MWSSNNPLGLGSNSHIFSANWKGKIVVVKIIQEEKMTNSIALDEFRIEKELLIRLDHPNVIEILGAGDAGTFHILHLISSHFISFHFISFSSLDSSYFQSLSSCTTILYNLIASSVFLFHSQHIGTPEMPRPFVILERLLDFCKAIELDEPMSMMRRRAVSYTGLLTMARDLAEGLNYLHTVHPEAMIIHRDIKPENLGMSHDGRLKLFDFGLCTCVKVRSTSRESYKMTGGTGSLRYMAPEVVLRMPYDESVDAYRYGSTTSRNHTNTYLAFMHA